MSTETPPMPETDFAKLRQLAALGPDDLGDNEEAVKINFAVPLLEALGHSRLRFEHRQRDIVLSQGLPRGMAILVETKRPREPLDRHLDQLERYAYQERSLLAVLTNGEEIRLYVPLWANAPSFAESLLLSVRRADLADLVSARRLAAVLGARALASGAADRSIRTAQARREQAWRHLAVIRAQARRQREGLEARLRDLTAQADQLAAEKSTVEGKLTRLDASLARSLDTLRTLYGVREPAPPKQPARPHLSLGAWPERSRGQRSPAVASGEGGRVRVPSQDAAGAQAPSPQPSPQGRGGEAGAQRRGPGPGRSSTPEWTDSDLTTMSTANQQRIFAAFARAGKRTLGTIEIAEAAGIPQHAVSGAISGFLFPARSGRKEHLFEIVVPPRAEYDRLGKLVTIAEKYWPIVCRLYRGTPSAAAPSPPSEPVRRVPPPTPDPTLAKLRKRKGRAHGWSKSLDWTDAELTTGSTERQHRILGAFVRAGQRTLGLFEIAASVGLRTQQAWGALTGFLTPVKTGRKEVLLQVTIPDRIERERRGVLITIADKYWPILRRLYAEAAEKRS
ncbi:MAG: hypothetical protein FJ290_07030 [Planctomycetes bacterium]|nr:hypothetical protein [Planctomycetota bacterium]